MIDWILFLIIAGVCAITAGAMVPGKLPGGFFGAVFVGLIGAWLGITLSAPIQLSLAGESILPAIFGSAVLSFGFAFISRKFAALEAKLDSALNSLVSSQSPGFRQGLMASARTTVASKMATRPKQHMVTISNTPVES